MLYSKPFQSRNLSNTLSTEDKNFIAYLRALSIFVIVFGHVGGFWFFEPYCELLYVFVPIFFFLSGAVSYHSFNRSPTVRSYYCKRCSRLLVPYYLLCIFSLLVYFFLEKQFPPFNISKFLMWIQIRPPDSSMPFGIGQVWFLHTLFFITIVSPIFFLLENKGSQYLIFYVSFILSISALQFFTDIHHYFYFIGNNLFKPIIHSCFYIFGIILFSKRIHFRSSVLGAIGLVSLVISIACAKVTTAPNLNAHTFSPDIYYVATSTFAILVFFFLKKQFIVIVEKKTIVHLVFSFFNHHSLSIFLLHSFSIFLLQRYLGMIDPTYSIYLYGILKTTSVLLITCLLAVPYSRISNRLAIFFSSWCLDKGVGRN